MRRAAAVAGLLVLLTLATGCASRNSEVDSLSATQGLPSTRVDLEAKDWLLNRVGSTVQSAEPVTLVVDDDRVSGTAPCNAYNGDFSLSRDDSVEITHVVTTRRACDPPTMAAEHSFIAALTAVDTVAVNNDDNRMVLSNDSPRVRLAFRSVETGDHLVGTWKIANFSDGTAITSPVAKTAPTITFTKNGRVQLVTGCNNAGANWTLEGDDLTIDNTGQTLIGCPPDIAAQETALTRALEATERAQASSTALTLLDGHDRIVLFATTATP